MSNEIYGPTPERLKKAGESVEAYSPAENEHWRAIRLLDGHVLEFLRNRDMITGDQHSAGAQFYADWYFAGLANSGVIDPSRIVVDGGSRDNVNDRKLFALGRWQKAVQALGQIHSQVLTDLLLSEVSLEDWGRRRFGHKHHKLARHSAVTALRLALDQLDIHYHGARHTRISGIRHERPIIMPAITDCES